MSNLLHDLLLGAADRFPDEMAVACNNDAMAYATLADTVSRVACGLVEAGLNRQQRVAIYLPKRLETVAAIFGTTMAGGVFVPVNPLLKADQVVHILRDCNVRLLVTTLDRFRELQHILPKCPDFHAAILLDWDAEQKETAENWEIIAWDSLLELSSSVSVHRVIDADMAAIFYTSGSTGKPKGVVLSHRNLIVGAESVSQYLGNCSSDRILAVLPLSFDYGFSQLSTAFKKGASVALIDYLFPKDVITAAERFDITGLAGVPPLLIQLAKLPWPEKVVRRLRYITNSGGAMPTATLDRLRAQLPYTKIFLMYGLTEAFRSTYLDPEELDGRPNSIGKAIPNTEILIVRDDGSPCDPGEPGELVHRGPLVSLGYWNDIDRTVKRFRRVPNQDPALVIPETAVWSGDTVVQDDEGFMFFVGRRDDMIKTSGYRVSPTEVEEAVYATGMVSEVAAVGVPHSVLGQAVVIVAVASPDHGSQVSSDKLLEECRQNLPNFMVPTQVVWQQSLPRNANGKIDRKLIFEKLKNLYQEDGS